MVRHKVLWLMAATCGLLGGGCGMQFDPDAAVLAGTWTATLDDGRTLSARFDSMGTLDTVTVNGLNGTPSTADVGGSTTSVDGDQVVITIPTAGDPVTYTATLSNNGTTLMGSLSGDIPFTDQNVTIPGGPLTLTKGQIGG